jgi:hypothetical protein
MQDETGAWERRRHERERSKDWAWLLHIIRWFVYGMSAGHETEGPGQPPRALKGGVED